MPQAPSLPYAPLCLCLRCSFCLGLLSTFIPSVIPTSPLRFSAGITSSEIYNTIQPPQHKLVFCVPEATCAAFYCSFFCSLCIKIVVRSLLPPLAPPLACNCWKLNESHPVLICISTKGAFTGPSLPGHAAVLEQQLLHPKSMARGLTPGPGFQGQVGRSWNKGISAENGNQWVSGGRSFQCITFPSLWGTSGPEELGPVQDRSLTFKAKQTIIATNKTGSGNHWLG